MSGTFRTRSLLRKCTTSLGNMDQYVKSERKCFYTFNIWFIQRLNFCQYVHTDIWIKVSEVGRLVPLCETLHAGLTLCVLLFFCFSEGTHLKQEEQLMWCMRTYLTPRTPVTICQASMSATVTWWSCTTTQTEYVWTSSRQRASSNKNIVWGVLFKFWVLFFVKVIFSHYISLYFINSLQAFQKMDTKKKEEQLKLLKEKYGINTDPPK